MYIVEKFASMAVDVGSRRQLAYTSRGLLIIRRQRKLNETQSYNDDEELLRFSTKKITQ